MDTHDARDYRPEGARGEAPVDRPTYEDVDVLPLGLTLRVWDTGEAEWYRTGHDERFTEVATQREYELGRVVLDALS